EDEEEDDDAEEDMGEVLDSVLSRDNSASSSRATSPVCSPSFQGFEESVSMGAKHDYIDLTSTSASASTSTSTSSGSVEVIYDSGGIPTAGGRLGNQGSGLLPPDQSSLLHPDETLD
ncbi:unnamed protein product, partial [Meganyctiphanes norvegica]